MAGLKMKNLFKIKDLTLKTQDLLLAVTFVIYLISNAKIPLMLEKMIDTTSGNIVIIILALIVMVKFNHVVGVDLFEIKDHANVSCLCLNTICWGTSLQDVVVIDNKTPSEVLLFFI